MSNWISGNRFLTKPEMQHNAIIFSQMFMAYGASVEAISGMLGNIQAESTVNPGIWEDLDDVKKGGYGLVQWTPYTKYSNWAGSDWQDNGDKEVKRIFFEIENDIQWIATDTYDFSFQVFIKMKNSPEYMADAFLKNYERPEITEQPIRGKYARDWYPFVQKIIHPFFYYIAKQKHRRIFWK